MWLKRLTALFLALCAFLLIAWPWVVGVDVPKDRQGAYVAGTRLLIYVSALALCLICAGIGSILVVRQARREYRKQASENMRRLVEGLKDEPHD